MSPRDTFRQDKSLTRGYNDLIGGNQMQAALDTAARELDLSLVIATDVTTAAANRWRKEGADKFRNILETLNASTVAPQTFDPSELNHKV